MNPVCREEFEKAKTLIRVRKDNMGGYVKPDVQNLDSGILLQFFENWEDASLEFDGKEIQFKKRIFNILNNKNIKDIYMYFISDYEIKNFDLEYDSLFINLDGSFDFICDGEITNMTPFSVATFEKGKSMRVENCVDINYFIVVNLKSPLF